MVLLVPLTSPIFLDINIFQLDFALVVTHLFSVTSTMLQRYIRPFSVQHFSNLSLKANTIEFCLCPISYSIFKIALRGWGYLPIGEMGNFAGRGTFMCWWKSEEEWFWPFKPFLELKYNIVKIRSVGVNVKFCRDNFFIGWRKFEEEWF